MENIGVITIYVPILLKNIWICFFFYPLKTKLWKSFFNNSAYVHLYTYVYHCYRLRRFVHQPELHGQPVFRQLLSDRERIVLQPSVLQEVLLRVVHARRSAAGRQRRSAELAVHHQHDQTAPKRSSQQTPEFELVLSKRRARVQCLSRRTRLSHKKKKWFENNKYIFIYLYAYVPINIYIFFKQFFFQNRNNIPFATPAIEYTLVRVAYYYFFYNYYRL